MDRWIDGWIHMSRPLNTARLKKFIQKYSLSVLLEETVSLLLEDSFDSPTSPFSPLSPLGPEKANI